MEEPVNVLLIGVPRLLSDIVTATFSSEPTIRVVGVAGTVDEPTEFVRSVSPDVVILGSDDPDLDADWIAVLTERPHLKVLAVDDDGRECFLYEMRPQRTPLGEISPQSLVEAVLATSTGAW